MRVTLNFSKASMQYVPADAFRIRVKRDENGNVMMLPTSRKLVSNLPKDEVARKLTRDVRKGTVAVALNYEGLAEGNYSVTQVKHNWLLLQRMSDDVVSLNVPRVRMCKKTG